MSIYPDQPTPPKDARQSRMEDILNHCPFLDLFIKGSNLQEYQEVYEKQKNNLTKELEQRVGASLDPLVDAHIPRLNRSNLFNTNDNLDKLREKISISILIGFELADMNQAELFIDDIMNRLDVKSIYNSTKDEVFDLIDVGVIYRSYLTSPEGARVTAISISPTDQESPNSLPSTDKTEVPEAFNSAFSNSALATEISLDPPTQDQPESNPSLSNDETGIPKAFRDAFNNDG